MERCRARRRDLGKALIADQNKSCR